MAQKYFSILTNIGIAQITNAITLDKKVNITHIAVGDGGGSFYTPQADMTALKNQCWKGVITKTEKVGDNVIAVAGVIPSSVGGFTIREVGIYDADNRLIAIANMPDTSKVAINEGVSSELEVTMQIIVSNTDVVKIEVDPTVILATKADIDKHNADLNAHNGHFDNAEIHTTSEEKQRWNNTYTKTETDNKIQQIATTVESLIVTFTHTKTGTVHALTGTSPTQGYYTARFNATADFAENDTFTINGTPYTAQQLNLEPLTADAFKTGATVSVEVDITGTKLNFKAGGGLNQEKIDLIAETYGVELTPLRVITTSGTYTLNYDFPVEVAVYGGGGAGGTNPMDLNRGAHGCSGGGSGEILICNFCKAIGNCTITVGKGGIQKIGLDTRSESGDNTIFIFEKSTIIAKGGEGGWNGIPDRNKPIVNNGGNGGARGGIGIVLTSSQIYPGGINGGDNQLLFKYSVKNNIGTTHHNSHINSQSCRMINRELTVIGNVGQNTSTSWYSDTVSACGLEMYQVGGGGYGGNGGNIFGYYVNGLNNGAGGGGYNDGGSVASMYSATAGGYGAGGAGGNGGNGGPGCVVIRKIIMPPKNN